MKQAQPNIAKNIDTALRNTSRLTARFDLAITFTTTDPDLVDELQADIVAFIAARFCELDDRAADSNNLDPKHELTYQLRTDHTFSSNADNEAF